jgi:hypothetical protein
MRDQSRIWAMIFICLALATVSMTALLLAYRSAENASLAEHRAHAAELRSAKNTLLNCIEIDMLRELAKKSDADKWMLDPLCMDEEVQRLREYVRQYEGRR